ncbi:MAG: indole-3-glycerol phosphate synthase TrpC [Actinomycetales bacterium]|nr:indole-3-glycerol phosphate synthase TrpC [Actinomycetales bacterium]
MSVLAEIVAATRDDLLRRREQQPERALCDAATRRLDFDPPMDVAALLRGTADVAVIAEVKRRSPSAGALADIPSAAAAARAYEAGGASMVSVLTEPRWFAGSLADLEDVAASVAIPVLRKDFIVDRYQIVEACAAGADAVLLIVAALSDTELRSLLDEAARWQLSALVEVHDEAEAERAAAAGAQVIGVNARNLVSLDVDTDTFARVAAHVPTTAVRVAESGLRTPADVAAAVRAGAHAVLIGQALVQSPDPTLLIAQMKEAARDAR